MGRVADSVRDDDNDDDKNDNRDDDRKKRRRKDRSSRKSKSRRDGDDDNNDEERRGRKRKERKKQSSSRKKRSRSSSKRKRKRDYSSSSSSSSSSDDSSSESSSSSSSSSDDRRKKKKKRTKTSMKKETTDTKKKIINKRLLEKLSARGETLEEREERRSQHRAARITAKFGYTADENPFNDPNLHETFTWKKRDEKVSQKKGIAKQQQPNDSSSAYQSKTKKSKQEHIFDEIQKVRNRRDEREKQHEEMERLKAEESRMKELENYDEWAKKEEEFHLQQQRQRSAIRLVEGREKPVDVLAKNLLLFGLSEKEKINRAAVKYQERYNAMDELETLEAELEEPHDFLKDLKLNELQDLLLDINTFLQLERESIVSMNNNNNDNSENENPVLQYWNALQVVTTDEIKYLNSGGSKGDHASAVEDIIKLFDGQGNGALLKMKDEIITKLQKASSRNAAFDNSGGVIDTKYWELVLQQLDVHLAKMELSDLHSKMLVRQLEKLEKKKDDLTTRAAAADEEETANDKDGNDAKTTTTTQQEASQQQTKTILPKGIEPGFGDLDEELGLTDEIDLNNNSGGKNTGITTMTYTWQDRYRPRKPKYFNRVKTGYDWNKYNQTHYDHDNPPPKIVQGYKFNIFYPDLIDKTKTPKYYLERCLDDTSGEGGADQFCIIRFKGGPPYEDLAFKILNKEWNKSRKRGFRCTFERGILSLYFNFASHWYRR